MPASQTTSRQALASFIIVVFLSYVLLLGISKEARDYAQYIRESSLSSGSSSKDKPDLDLDLDQYVWTKTLSDEELDFDHPDRRILFVGDIHGMKPSFDKLLAKLDYNEKVDHLIHVGDIVAKGPLQGSLDVLAYMTRHNVSGVRGNHDQMVIGWHAWIDNVLSHPDGEEWLKDVEEKSANLNKGVRKVFLKQLKKYPQEDWKRIPDDWEFMGDHYTIARRMSPAQATYLLSLPLVLHIPRLHSFIVHAGLLPLDPRRSPTSLRQPLAHVPDSSSLDEEDVNSNSRRKEKVVKMLRTMQEEALLSDIPQNHDPWVVLNMRSLLKDNSISRKAKKGSAWAPLWNATVGRCGGFDLDLDLDSEDDEDDEEDDDEKFARKHKKSKEKPLPCHPATVLYGHSASRGLDIKRWSKGLDTGCVYGRRLTALVLTPPGFQTSASSFSDEDEDSITTLTNSRKHKMRFGDPNSKTANAHVVSVDCPDL